MSCSPLSRGRQRASHMVRALPLLPPAQPCSAPSLLAPPLPSGRRPEPRRAHPPGSLAAQTLLRRERLRDLSTASGAISDACAGSTRAGDAVAAAKTLQRPFPPPPSHARHPPCGPLRVASSRPRRRRSVARGCATSVLVRSSSFLWYSEHIPTARQPGGSRAGRPGSRQVVTLASTRPRINLTLGVPGSPVVTGRSPGRAANVSIRSGGIPYGSA